MSQDCPWKDVVDILCWQYKESCALVNLHQTWHAIVMILMDVSSLSSLFDLYQLKYMFLERWDKYTLSLLLYFTHPYPVPLIDIVRYQNWINKKWCKLFGIYCSYVIFTKYIIKLLLQPNTDPLNSLTLGSPRIFSIVFYQLPVRM